MVTRLKLSYCGTRYAGWQRQSNALAVQEVVEEALGRLVGGPVRVFGASRTDAGVHARDQVVHFELPRAFPLPGLVFGANHRLPADVRVLAAAEMAAGFDARKSALGKTYLYRVHRGRAVSPLEAPFVLRVESRLELAAIRSALALLPGRHDWSAFALAGGSHGQPFRRLFAATVDEAGRELHFRFTGEGFLRGMVRSLVGTLLEVGTGRRSPGSLAELLAGRARPEAGPTAAAHGLVLESVFYPSHWQPLASFEA